MENISDFFSFGSKLSASTVTAHPVNLQPGTEGNDPGEGERLISGDIGDIRFPVVFKQEYGSKFLDVLDTGFVSLYLISDKMKSIFQETGLTGWSCFPIELRAKKGEDIKGYNGLSIHGRCGPIDISKSEIVYKRLVAEGPLCTFYRGKHIGLDEWDGTDFFLPENNFGIVITRRAADIIKANKLTNIRLNNLAEIEFDQGTAELIRSKS